MRIVELERELEELARRFRHHARDSLGRASSDQPHPVQIVDQIEVTSRMRMGVGGIYIAGATPDAYRTYYVPGLQATAVEQQWPRTLHGGVIGLAVGSREAKYELRAEQSNTEAVTLSIVAREAQTPRARIVPGVVVLAPLTSDPSPLEEGMMWFRADTGQLRVRINGATKNVQLS